MASTPFASISATCAFRFPPRRGIRGRRRWPGEMIPGRALQGQPDERPECVERLDLVGRKQRLAGVLRNVEARDNGISRRRTDAAPGICRRGGSRRFMHPQQFILASSNSWFADGGEIEPITIRTRWSARHETSPTKTGSRRSDARRDERRVGVALRRLFTTLAMVSDPPAGTMIFFILSLGSGDPDSAGRRHQIAVEIIDCENAQLRPAADRRSAGVTRVRSRRPPAKGIDRSCADHKTPARRFHEARATDTKVIDRGVVLLRTCDIDLSWAFLGLLDSAAIAN